MPRSGCCLMAHLSIIIHSWGKVNLKFHSIIMIVSHTLSKLLTPHNIIIYQASLLFSEKKHDESIDEITFNFYVKPPWHHYKLVFFGLVCDLLRQSWPSYTVVLTSNRLQTSLFLMRNFTKMPTRNSYSSIPQWVLFQSNWNSHRLVCSPAHFCWHKLYHVTNNDNFNDPKITCMCVWHLTANLIWVVLRILVWGSLMHACIILYWWLWSTYCFHQSISKGT